MEVLSWKFANNNNFKTIQPLQKFSPILTNYVLYYLKNLIRVHVESQMLI